MTTQETKETVSLDDLRKAIDAIGGAEPPMFADEPLVENYARLSDFHRRKAVAWRTAANFIVQYVNVGGNGYREFMEGINLIREKLS